MHRLSNFTVCTKENIEGSYFILFNFAIMLFTCRLERVVEPWTEGLFPALKKLLGVPIAPSENNEENGVALDSTQVEKQKQHDGTEITSEHGTMLEARKLSSLVSRKGSPRTCFSASSSPKLERVASPEGKKASLSVAGAGQPTASSLSVHRGSVDMSTMSSVNMARNSFSDLSVAPKSPGLGKKGGKKTVIAWQYGGAGKSKERRTSAVPVANSTTQESSKKKVGEKTRSSAAQGDASGGVKSSSKTEASEELHNTKQLVNVMEALKESLPALKGVRLNLPALRPEKFIVEYPKVTTNLHTVCRLCTLFYHLLLVCLVVFLFFYLSFCFSICLFVCFYVSVCWLATYLSIY